MSPAERHGLRLAIDRARRAAVAAEDAHLAAVLALARDQDWREPRPCSECEQTFTPVKPNHMTCSHVCRDRRAGRLKAAARVEARRAA